MPEKNIQENVNLSILSLRGARLSAVQAIYQIELTKKAGKKVMREFLQYRITEDIENSGLQYANKKFFQTLVKEVVENYAMLDEKISQYLSKDWSLDRLDPIIRGALRCATYELINRLEVPVPAIIDEYIGVVAAFGDEKEIKFVNGVLHNLAEAIGAKSARITI